MSLIVVGLNHRSTPLDVLERVTVDDARLPKALHDLCSRDNLSEAVVLSTCNRTEIYAMAERFHGAVQDIRSFLSDLSHLPPEAFADYLFVAYEDAAATHLFEVAAGLQSAVIGESEILGQVKRAWERAQVEGAAGPNLNDAFRHAVAVGKRARAETSIGRHITSVSHAAVAMAAERLGGSLDGRKVLVLGAGDMGGGMAASVRAWAAADVLVVNRTWERAVALADSVGGRPVPLLDLPAALREVDVLLTSTGATSIMVDHGDLQPVMGARGAERPLLIVDVAVPRDVDPAVADLDGVTLLDMDDLRAFAARGIERRQREVGRVREIIEEEVLRHIHAGTTRQAAPLVAALHTRADALRAAELDRFAARLHGLDQHQLEAVEALTRGIVGKLLHEPTVRVKDSAGSTRGERLAEALRELFDL